MSEPTSNEDLEQEHDGDSPGARTMQDDCHSDDSDDRGISDDLAYFAAKRKDKENLRAFARRYKPVTEVEIAQRNAFMRVRALRSLALPPRVPLVHFYNMDLLKHCPVRVSHLPFYTDGIVDLDLRFTQPMDADVFEEALDYIFGQDAEDLIRYLDRHWQLPLSKTFNPRCSQAEDQAEMLWTILQMRQGTPDIHEERPYLLTYTDLKSSLQVCPRHVRKPVIIAFARLPSDWPWPDQCGDAQDRRDLYAHRLQAYWCDMGAMDWIGQGSGWFEGATFASGMYGKTPPHVLFFLAHQATPNVDNPASMPELHYITFLIRERLRDPG